MKLKKKLILILSALFVMINGISVGAEISDKQVTMDDINTSGEKTIAISEESVYYSKNSILNKVRSKGKYPIYARVITTQSSSNGIKQCSSKTGTYSSIASFALSFIPGIKAMTVSQIFGAVSLAVGNEQYSQAKTFKSYIDYRKEGQAKWSNDKAYSTYIYSGKRNYYKHVLAGKKNKDNKWTTKMKDYITSPSKTIKGNYYGQSDKWFKKQATQRIQNGLILDDVPW